MKTVFVIGNVYNKSDVFEMLSAHLPSWAKVRVNRDGDSAFAEIHSSIWVNEFVQVGCSYNKDQFSDRDILTEQAQRILAKCGVHTQELWSW